LAKYIGEVPALYEFFQSSLDILIASLAEEANNHRHFPTVDFGRQEYAIPQVGYYRQFRQRIDLIRAQYSPDLAQVQNLLRTYGVDFWLLERSLYA